MQIIKREDGLTMVEVLVATTITLTVLALTLQAFRGALDVNDAIRLAAGTNQNLQVSNTWVADDLVKAGQSLPTGGINIPNGNNSQPVLRPGPGGLTIGGSILFAVLPGDDLGPEVSPPDAEGDDVIRTDTITVIYVDQEMSGLPLTYTNPDTGLDVTEIGLNGTNMRVHWDDTFPVGSQGVQINTNSRNRVRAGDLFLFRNTLGVALQEATADGDEDDPQLVEFVTGGGELNLNQPTAQFGTLLRLRSAGVYPPTTVSRVMMVTYFLDVTQGVPMLMRQVNGRDAEPIGLGIENLQFSYGTYTGGTVFTNVAQPDDPNEIRKINVFLGSRSEVRSQQSGNFVRNTMMAEVNVRNLGFFDAFK